MSGVTEWQSGWPDVSQLLSLATLVLVWQAHEGNCHGAEVLVVSTNTGSLSSDLSVTVAEFLTS